MYFHQLNIFSDPRHRKQTFKQRAVEISDQAANSRSAMGEGAEFARGLDDTERQCKSLVLSQYLFFMKLIYMILQYSEPLTTVPMQSENGSRPLKSHDET